MNPSFLGCLGCCSTLGGKEEEETCLPYILMQMVLAL